MKLVNLFAKLNIITISQAVEVYGIHERTLQRACEAGKIDCVKLGTVWLMRSNDPYFLEFREWTAAK